MTSRCARCVGSALPPTVCTAPMGKDLRLTPTRTDTSDSGEKQRISEKQVLQSTSWPRWLKLFWSSNSQRPWGSLQCCKALHLCVFSPPIRGEDGCFLYGVFNGYDGSRVASFASQRLTAELLLGQINSSHTDNDIRRILTQVIPDSVFLLSCI